MPQYTGTIKPRILVDTDRLSAEITVPFVEEDGSGNWVKTVTFSRATTTLTATVRDVFGKVEQLKKLTFIGTHEGKTVIKVWLTRSQAQQLNLRQVEEHLSVCRKVRQSAQDGQGGRTQDQKISSQGLQRGLRQAPQRASLHRQARTEVVELTATVATVHPSWTVTIRATSPLGA